MSPGLLHNISWDQFVHMYTVFLEYHYHSTVGTDALTASNSFSNELEYGNLAS